MVTSLDGFNAYDSLASSVLFHLPTLQLHIYPLLPQQIPIQARVVGASILRPTVIPIVVVTHLQITQANGIAPLVHF